jgi:hypothetical protein
MGKFICVFLLLVIVQLIADEGIEGDRANEGVEAGGDGARAETSARGASTAETTGDDTEVEANVATKAFVTDAAAAPEV